MTAVTDIQPFISKPGYFNVNRRKASSLHARPGVIIHHDESQELAVALMNDRMPVVLLTRNQAVILANQIADILTHHNQKENTND
ncbi:hypothetical protein [Neomicrococcus lactis]|uniref:hypothetical protein n=1 Tax=Neomicrococcus lactis TaxID=732241 RepID=UPI0023018613|nr:hypothetical protein [Neomicrococcus lactis]